MNTSKQKGINMEATIIDGNRIAKEIREKLANEMGSQPLGLGLLCSESSKASDSYQRAILKVADSLGIKVVRFGTEATQEELAAKIDEWNNNPAINGIFILQPFSDNIDVEGLRAIINPFKDIECVHPYDTSLKHYSTTRVGSCTAVAIMEILQSLGTLLEGAEVVVVGHSAIVGQPITSMLIKEGATVTSSNKATFERKKLEWHVGGADILIVAVGNPNFIPGAWIKEGAIVIDVGVTDVGEGKIAGDVDFDTAVRRAGYITPVTGGVGPITTIVLMRQLFIAYQLQQRLQKHRK